MPTKRQRVRRGAPLNEGLKMLLGLGAGMNHVPGDELKALWTEYGAEVTDYWQRRFGREPFVGMLAREEGW